jgi:hypothetical protein
MIALLWEGNTRSYRRFPLDGRKPKLTSSRELTGLSNGKGRRHAGGGYAYFNDKVWLMRPQAAQRRDILWSATAS